MACKWEQLGILCKGLRPGVYSGKLLLHMKFWTVFLALQSTISLKLKKVLLQMRTVLLRAKVYDLIKVELPSPEELPCTQLLLSHIQTCFLTHSWTIQANHVRYCQHSLVLLWFPLVKKGFVSGPSLPQNLTPQWHNPAPLPPWFSAHCAPIFVNKKTKTSEKITFKQSRSPLLGVRWSTSAGFSASTRPSIGAGRRFPRALEWDSGLVH